MNSGDDAGKGGMDEQIERTVQSVMKFAPAGSTVAVIIVKTPEGASNLIGVGGEMAPAAAEGAPRPTLLRQDHTPATAAEKVRAHCEKGGEPLKAEQWGKLLGPEISAREIERALAAGALTAEKKGSGKDHRSVVIKAEDVRQYVSYCTAVQKGVQPRPAWWETVRKGENGVIYRDHRVVA